MEPPIAAPTIMRNLSQVLGRSGEGAVPGRPGAIDLQ